jgi:hypothetical protein
VGVCLQHKWQVSGARPCPDIRPYEIETPATVGFPEWGFCAFAAFSPKCTEPGAHVARALSKQLRARLMISGPGPHQALKYLDPGRVFWRSGGAVVDRFRLKVVNRHLLTPRCINKHDRRSQMI